MRSIFGLLVCTALAAGCGDDDPSGDTWESFAQPFFATNCTSCHSTANVGTARNGAPEDFNWDDEASVRMQLVLIRRAAGPTTATTSPYMPPSDSTGPRPSESDRQRLADWIDDGAP